MHRRDGYDRNIYRAGVAFVDGELVPVKEARIPILDWGFLHSDATYDVVHVWRGRFFRLEDHLDRFERGMERLRLHSPLSRDEIRDVLSECVGLSDLRDAYAEVVCTRGIPSSGSRDPRSCENRFYAFVVPFVWIADPEKQRSGLHATITRIERISPRSVDPTIKNYHWLDLTTGLFEAYERGGETAILIDGDANVVEGPGFNIFAVTDGGVATPELGVLEGITRMTVIELAGDLGLSVDKRPVSASELRDADEVFVTSTAGGIMPVTTIDGRHIGDGSPGDVTNRLRDAYWKAHEDPVLSTPVEYGSAQQR